MPVETSAYQHAGSRLFARFAAAVSLAVGYAASAATPAPLVTPQQLTVTAANAVGDSIYNLSLKTTATTGLINGIQALNTDGSKHGAFDALVWAPNAFTGTLDLIVADATRQQILRYAGPSYGTSTVLFTYAGKGSGPAYPTGLATDSAGNLFVISPSSTFFASPMVWVLPYKGATGTFGAPVLVDQAFSGVKTLALADVLVAGTAATPIGNAAPTWAAGDILVLVGDTFNSRVLVYSKSAIGSLLANPKTPLPGPTTTVVTSKQFLGQIAAPFGFDIWPADSTHGVSLLFTTIDGRIIRFDTKQNAFTGNFASGLGLGLTKLKVGAFAGTPYAFVAQLALPNKGQILQFGAPPASGTHKPVATISQGMSDPIGLALTSSGSTPAASCVAPQSCSPLGPQATTQISGPGAKNIPPGATILEQSCTIPTDPRVTVVNGQWSCLAPPMNVCGSTPTAGCVSPTLDVANYCPGFPSTILPATMCGHAGANGAGLVVVKATAALLDSNANDIYIQTGVDATIALPGPYDLGCQTGMGQFGPLVAWAPRSDLRSVEGTIVEDQTSPYFADFTGFCDKSGTNTHVESMFAYGLGLNAGVNGIGTGANAALGGFVNTKFNDLQTMIHNAAPQITPQTVTTTLESYVTQSQSYFNSDYTHDVNNYSCALNSIASADVYLRQQAGGPGGNAFSYTGPASGNNNPNPAGEVDGRLANLYQTISGDFLFTPNPTWPTSNVPACEVLTITGQPSVGGTATINFGPPQTPAATPLDYGASQCTLSATDGTYATAHSVGTMGTNLSTGTLTKAGTYTATLQCGGTSSNTAVSFTTAAVQVSATPTLKTVTVTPANPSIPNGTTQQFMATGTNTANAPMTLGTVTWQTNNGVATISSGGLATCLQVGSSLITATSSGVSGSTTLKCTAPTLKTVTVTPANPSIANGTTQQFAATGTNTAGGPFTLGAVAWQSMTTAVATITAGGLASCVQTGRSLITATSGGGSGSTTLTCVAPTLKTVTVTPANPSIPNGTAQQFTAAGTNTAGGPYTLTSVFWQTSNGVASINQSGVATCAQTGQSVITATDQSSGANGLVGSTTLTCVTPTLQSITVTPATQSLAAGLTQQFTASGTNNANGPYTLTGVTWQASGTAVSITPSGGVAKCLQAGPPSQITATDPSTGISGNATLTCTAPTLATVTVAPANPSIPAGTTQQFTASGTDTQGNLVTLGSVTWAAVGPAATIGTSGLATCNSTSTQSSTITATSGGVSGSTGLNCAPPILASIAVSPASTSIATGATQQFHAAGTDTLGGPYTLSNLKWGSNNALIAIDQNSGLATCNGPGNATITATNLDVSGTAQLTCDAAVGSVSLSVDKSSVRVGNNVNLSWTSSNLLPDVTCELSSNSTDAFFDEGSLPTNGSAQTTDTVPQKETFTIDCSGAAQSVSSSVDVTFSLTTTYQYTGNFFTSTYKDYSSLDRVIASITSDVPFAPNMSEQLVNSSNTPGFSIVMSDGQQTLGTYNGVNSSEAFITTDPNGVITAWSVGNNTDNSQGQGNGISTQGFPHNGTNSFGNEGTVDFGYKNLGSGEICGPITEPDGTTIVTDCGINSQAEGLWTRTDITSPQVIVSTTTGPKSGQLFRVIVGGSLHEPTLDASTILAETPEPTACTGGTGVNTGAGITSLAWAGIFGSGSVDVVASNGPVGDVFRLAGPSTQPSSDLFNASPGCWNTGPIAVSTDVSYTGAVVGAGHDAAHAQTPSVYLFPPSGGTTAPNFVLIENVNQDPALVANCGSSDGSAASSAGCVTTLVDTLVAPFSQGPISSGDVLVLVGDAYNGTKPVVLRLPASAVDNAKNFSTKCPSSYGNTSGQPPPCIPVNQPNGSGGSVVVGESDLPLFPSEVPVSMGLSFFDGSLYIATNQGRIFQLQSTATGYTSATLWATADQGLQKMRVGYWNEQPYVFATVHGTSGDEVVVFAGYPNDVSGFTMASGGVATATVSGAVSGLAVQAGVHIGGSSN